MLTKHWSDKTVLQFIMVKRPIEYAGMSLDQVQELRSSSVFSPQGFLWSSNNSVTVDDEFWALVRRPVLADTQMSVLEAHAKEVFHAKRWLTVT